MKIHLSNSLTRQKDEFIPIDKNNVRMYVCGPTVYDRPHLGNARSAVVYDVIYRLLKAVYPRVTYARNITDVDDKIINASKESGKPIGEITTTMTEYYHQDMAALSCLSPSVEPRATTHIQEMIDMIQDLISKGHAYEAENHVLFAVESFKEYGKLARRSVEDMIAGARVEVAPYKKNPADFVLWKPADDNGFPSPWGKGRPGWHIECSAMSKKHLGSEFDIHGGGADLMFPHHENEVAQSECANGHKFARYWVHNGFLTVGGEKMSKSLGNFKTVREVLEEGVEGVVIRYLYLTTHYKKPLDFNDKAIEDSKKSIERFRLALKTSQTKASISSEVLEALADDMNTPLALAKLHEYANAAIKGSGEDAGKLFAGCELLGLNLEEKINIIPKEVEELAQKRLMAKIAKKWELADELRNNVIEMGYEVLDTKDSYELRKINKTELIDKSKNEIPRRSKLVKYSKDKPLDRKEETFRVRSK
jgi:cysteinyl-tRNA synthetase